MVALQKELLRLLDDVEAAPGVEINTGGAGTSSSGIPFLPTSFLHPETDSAAIRMPDARATDDGESWWRRSDAAPYPPCGVPWREGRGCPS